MWHGLVTVGGYPSVGGRWSSFVITLVSFVVNLDIIFLHVIGDGQHIARIASHCITQLFAFIDVLQMVTVESLLYIKQVVLKIAKGVRLEIRKIGNIIFVLELIAKAEGIQSYCLCCFIFILVASDVLFVELIVWSALSSLGLEFVLVVAHVLTSSSPVVGSIFPVLLGTVNEGLHSNLVA